MRIFGPILFFLSGLLAAGCPTANPHWNEVDAGPDGKDAMPADDGGPGDDGASGQDDGDLQDADTGLTDGDGNVEDGDGGQADADDPGFRRERSCATVFSYAPAGSVSRVQLAGEWDWATPEDMQEQNGVYALARDLAPGLYCYKLIVDGEWILDPGNPYQAYCNGVLNSGARVPGCEHPLLTLEGEAAVDGSSFHARIHYHAAQGGSGPHTFLATLMRNFVTTPLEADWLREDWSLELSLQDLAPGKYTVRIQARDADGREAEPLLLPFWIQEESFDWRDATIYMILTDRFTNGDADNDPDPVPGAYPAADFLGGDFRGVTGMIESGYFDSLGVRALWLTPFNTNASGTDTDSGSQHPVTGYHGYWPVEPRGVDPRLGTPDDLKAMVAAAHDHGIRILMDFVVNHVHEDHVYFQDHPDWFNDGCICGTPGCDWTTERLTCLFNAHMPDIDWKSKPASEQFIADGLWWLETYDLDGARIDAVKHVDDLCVFNLATRVRETFERAGTDYYLDGETAMGWVGDNLEDNAGEYGTINRYLGAWGLDGQFDFVLYHAVVNNVFVYDLRGYLHLDVWTGHSQTQYLPGSIMTPYVGSHDTSRLITRADYRGQDADHPVDMAYHKWIEQGLPTQPGDDQPYQRALCAFCWLLTIPGAPVIYMGDEYGEYGGGDPDNRHMHRPGDELSSRESGLLDKVRTLGLARRDIRALRRGDYRSLGSTETVMVFARQTPDGEAAVVAINGSGDPETVSVDVDGLEFTTATFENRLGFGGQMQVDGSSAAITLPPRSCVVFTQ